MFVAFTLYTWRTTCEVFFPQIIGTSCLQLSGFDSTALDKSKINSFFQFKWLIDISFSTLCCKLSHIYRKFTKHKKASTYASPRSRNSALPALSTAFSGLANPHTKSGCSWRAHLTSLTFPSSCDCNSLLPYSLFSVFQHVF